MTTLTLDWTGDLTFRNGAGSPPIELHSSTPGQASPMHVLAYATMACMGMDVVHVLTKGRHDLRALSVHFEGERADQAPRRYVTIKIHFRIAGAIDEHVVERAIELSRTKYCSVLATLRPDLDVTTGFTISAD